MPPNTAHPAIIATAASNLKQKIELNLDHATGKAIGDPARARKNENK